MPMALKTNQAIMLDTWQCWNKMLIENIFKEQTKQNVFQFQLKITFNMVPQKRSKMMGRHF